MKVATTRAELHKIQHKSIQVVAEGIGLENYLIRNVAALRNFQCNVCLRKIKTLCRHALFEFLSGRIGSSRAHKRTLVAGKEELNFEDLQEGNNLSLKQVPGGFITGKKKSSTNNRQKLYMASSSIILPLITRVKQQITSTQAA